MEKEQNQSFLWVISVMKDKITDENQNSSIGCERWSSHSENENVLFLILIS